MPNKGSSHLTKTEFRIMNFKPYSASGLEHFIVASNKLSEIEWIETALTFFLDVMQVRSVTGASQAKIEVSAGIWFQLEAWGQNLLLRLPAVVGRVCSLWRWA